MVWTFLATLGITLLLLTACNGSNTNNPEPLVRVATSDALDAGFVTYRHETDVFSLRIPPGWVSNSLPDDNGVRVEFSTLEGDQSVVRLTVYVVNTGAPLTQETFLQTAQAYVGGERSDPLELCKDAHGDVTTQRPCACSA